MRIAMLHTADGVRAIFEAMPVAGAVVTHDVDVTLLADAARAGAATPEIVRRGADRLVAMAAGVDAVLLTCSTMGAAAELAQREARVPVLRVDAALADEAAARGQRTLVLCAAATTLEPTRRLFEQAAAGTAATIDLELVEGAWARFQAGDLAAYHRMIAEAADRAYGRGYEVVALAQASMSGAATLCTKGRPLTSPDAGVSAALAAAGRARA